MWHRNLSGLEEMSDHGAVNQALGRIAEILLGRNAKVDLNGFLEVLEELEWKAYRQGYDDGLTGSDEERNLAADREYELRFRGPAAGD